MEEGSMTEVSKEKASCSSSVVKMEMEKMLHQSMKGYEKLMGQGSVTMTVEGKAISSCSEVKIDEEKILEHSVGAKEKLVQVSETMRAEKEATCSSWVVEVEKMLQHDNPSLEMARSKQHSIYLVPEFIKKMANNGDAYRPQFVSLGPYHHGEPHLLPMEEHKQRAVLHRVKRAGKPLGEFVAAIEEVADELEATYVDLDDKWRGAKRGSFVKVMVMDGCFLLELIRTMEILIHGIADDDYAANEPIFSKHRFHSLWSILRNDMIAIENQLPLLVLQRLLAVQHGTFQSARYINNQVLGLLDCKPLEEGMDNLGLHPLDIYHKSYCGTCPRGDSSGVDWSRTPCAVELSEAGIRFKMSNTNSIHDVDFENGVLSMPLFELDDCTEIILLNLVAFEQLHRDAGNYVTGYFFFMDNIIDSGTDVALLRTKGLIKHFLGSDKEVAKLFNTLGKGAMLNTSSRLAAVQQKVNAHCEKPWNRWRANFVQTHLSNPWVFISLVAAVILLIATIMQTVYTVLPFYTKRASFFTLDNEIKFQWSIQPYLITAFQHTDRLHYFV